MTSNGYKVSFGGDENVLELAVVAAQSCDHTKTHEIAYALK